MIDPEEKASQIVIYYLTARNTRDGDVPAEMILEYDIREAIKQAIAEAREECAQIADNCFGNSAWMGTPEALGYNAACERIAEEIRALGEPTP